MQSADESLTEPRSRTVKKIRTARSLRAINSGVRQGFIPIFRKVAAAPDIRIHYRLMRNKRTGEVVNHLDGHDTAYDSPSWEEVLSDKYYPHQFKNPYAAYLLPKDIKPGEQVLLLDLIEDYLGAISPDGDSYRLESCMAIWNGTDLEIQYDPQGSTTVHPYPAV